MFTKGSFIRCECQIRALTTYLQAITLPTTEVKSRHHLIKRLQSLECLELLVCVETGLKNEVTQQVRDFHRRQTFLTELLRRCAGGINTYVRDLLREYLPFTRLSKLLAYSESTGIHFVECPVLLSILSWIFM